VKGCQIRVDKLYEFCSPQLANMAVTSTSDQTVDCTIKKKKILTRLMLFKAVVLNYFCVLPVGF